ncbi:uncharacterized protein isoform X2 [Takifugu rubripes]|nr:uncharacterized protein LOC115249904 isoform X2 [Takifugu rubripes]
MSRRQPPNVHQLHSYEYAPCHLNHPLFPKITPRQPVDTRRPKVPVQHPTWNVPAGHQPPRLDVDDLLSKLLNSGVIKLPEVPAPEKRLSQKSIDDLLAYLLSAGVIKAPHSNSTWTPSAAIQSEEEAPDLQDFSKTKMKRRYENVIQELYMETQCSQCALRFKQSDQYKEHLESHQNSPPSKTRSWYASVNEWINHNPKDAGEEMTPIGDPEEPDSIRNCPLR